jgi:hypothetical protein
MRNTRFGGGHMTGTTLGSNRKRAHVTGVIVMAAGAALLVAACGSSGSKASSTTATPGASTATTQSVSASATSSPSGPTTTAASTATLPADICTIFDVSTVSSTLGAPDITSTRSMGDEDNEPSCLFGTLGPSHTSVQVTAFTGADFATKKTGWKIAFPAVQGAGQGAWSRGVVPLGANLKNAVLYVDYGSFGLQLSLGGANVTVDQAVSLANKIK